jgi:hypothetical protein
MAGENDRAMEASLFLTLLIRLDASRNHDGEVFAEGRKVAHIEG